MNRSERVVAQLGMSHGAAANRLRKMVLFRQLKKYGDNICARCSKMIEQIEELSIEHLKPWENVSPELFWNLDNVAFAHMSCNAAARRPPSAQPLQRKIGPDGTSWCYKCESFLPVEQFYKDPGRYNGLNGRCITCHKSRPR